MSTKDLVILLLLGFWKMGSNTAWRYLDDNNTSSRDAFNSLDMDEYLRKAKFVSCCLILQVEEAKELVRLAIHAGIMSDLGSGNNIDICVITREGADYIRPFQESEYKDNRWAIQSDSSPVVAVLL